MAKARFLCVSKFGTETFTVQLEPVDHESTMERHSDTHTQDDRGAILMREKGKRKEPTFFADLPHGSIFLSVLTPEAAAQFAVGKVTEVSFALVDG